MEHEISLQISRWSFDTEKPLGPAGGFGEVFHGTGIDGSSVAVKQLKLDAKAAAYRELRIAEILQSNELAHVIPFLDAGQDAESDRYYVVMPVAEKSLSEHLNEFGSVDEPQAVEILLSIAKGLQEVEEFVHRDLKPGNILFYDSTWRIADFGIAKFIEESTSVQTLKDCLSPPFAAPEQWRFFASSHATDIYSLGCIGYCLLTGHPPFPGPEMADFQKQHLSDLPESIDSCSPRLRAFLLMMLRKAVESRPSLSRVVSMLNSAAEACSEKAESVNLGVLAEAGAQVAKEQSEAEAEMARAQAAKEKRREIAQEAEYIFRDVRNELFEAINMAAPVANREDEARIRLGGAVLFMHLTGTEGGFLESPFKESGWDVVLGGEITVRQDAPTYIWSSSLWYTKMFPEDEYRWREVSYFGGSIVYEYAPYSLVSDPDDADIAASQITGAHQIAFGPVPIDDEEMESFISRWGDLFAKAAQGRLGYPSRLPL